MKIARSTLPYKSVLNAQCNVYDFVDSFQGNLFDKNDDISSVEIGKSFFLSAPNWISILFAFRDKVAGLLGLKISGKKIDRKKMLDNFRCAPGDRMGLFKVYNKTTNEIVLGEDDKHLNFRVSLFIDQQTSDRTNKTLVISTTVKFNNWFGRLYFLPVKPFHKLIVPAILRGIIKNIENRN